MEPRSVPSARAHFSLVAAANAEQGVVRVINDSFQSAPQSAIATNSHIKQTGAPVLKAFVFALARLRVLG